MGDIARGDLVIGGDGQPVRVKAVFPQGVKQVYSVSFSDGTKVECCDEHLWKVRRGGQNKWEILPLKAFKGRLSQGGKRYAVPSVIVSFETKKQPLDAYAMGVLLGDGGFSRPMPRISNPEHEIVCAVSDALPTGSRLSPCSSPIDWQICKGTAKHSLTEILVDLGLQGCKSKDKFIPPQYLWGDISQRHSLLQGLLDTDGYTDGTTVEYSTSSERLCNDVVFLVQSLGGKASVVPRLPSYVYNGERRIGHKSFRVYVSLPSSLQPFRLTRKASVYRPRTKYPPTRWISSIDEVDAKPCQCISVDSADGLYVTNGCIVTHNTHVAVGMAVQALKSQSIERIVLTRPAVDSGASIGYLPGTMEEKIGPYLVPLFDELSYYVEPKFIKPWMEHRRIEIVPLTMMRGRTFTNSYVILDEAQNATLPEIRMCLTRIGANSKMILVGDLFQTDLPTIQRGGFDQCITRLRDLEGVGICELGAGDIVRHPLIAAIEHRLTTEK